MSDATREGNAERHPIVTLVTGLWENFSYAVTHQKLVPVFPAIPVAVKDGRGKFNFPRSQEN